MRSNLLTFMGVNADIPVLHLYSQYRQMLAQLYSVPTPPARPCRARRQASSNFSPSFVGGDQGAEHRTTPTQDSSTDLSVLRPGSLCDVISFASPVGAQLDSLQSIFQTSGANLNLQLAAVRRGPLFHVSGRASLRVSAPNRTLFVRATDFGCSLLRAPATAAAVSAPAVSALTSALGLP